MPSTPLLCVAGEALREIEFRNALFFQETMNQKNRQGEKEMDMAIGFFVSFVRKIYFFMLVV
jgi:hypothetical protein